MEKVHRLLTPMPPPRKDKHTCARLSWVGNRHIDSPSRADDTEAAQRLLLRDVYGNPFCPAPPLDRAARAWGGGAIPALARAIYEGRAFDRLPVLADALEEAGCEDEDFLAHCRGAGPHARGCWLLDLILGMG